MLCGLANPDIDRDGCNCPTCGDPMQTEDSTEFCPVCERGADYGLTDAERSTVDIEHASRLACAFCGLWVAGNAYACHRCGWKVTR